MDKTSMYALWTTLLLIASVCFFGCLWFGTVTATTLKQSSDTPLACHVNVSSALVLRKTKNRVLEKDTRFLNQAIATWHWMSRGCISIDLPDDYLPWPPRTAKRKVYSSNGNTIEHVDNFICLIERRLGYSRPNNATYQLGILSDVVLSAKNTDLYAEACRFGVKNDHQTSGDWTAMHSDISLAHQSDRHVT